MLWRAPWLRHRLGLMGFAAWDGLSLYLSYNLICVARLGSWAGTTLGLLVMASTWMGVSYLAGRYSPEAEGRRVGVGVQISKTLVAGSAVIAVFIGHSWLYQVVDAQTRFRGFLVPLVLSSCLLSTVGQWTGSKFFSKKKRWLIICGRREREAISRELQSESEGLQGRTSFAQANNISRIIEAESEMPRGIAVGSIKENTSNDNERLLGFREKGGAVIPVLSWCEQELQRIPPELIHTEWLVQAEGFSLRPGSISWRVKRLGDILGALALILLSAPLVVGAGLFIWVEDRGPIFYKQIRTGLYGRPIRIWKLRSMRVNAERDGAQWASKHDSRITRIGKIIRATRIDELPQLFSVLSGDLSLIGPRPERPEIEERLEELIPNYRIRHWIRPGLSGWAQVCYPYGASIDDSRMKLSYDLYYLRNASLPLDLLITLKTIRLISGARGASPSAPSQSN